ncbi:hypothetical protein [Nocardia sp. NPDC127526]|uniref:hypothetical protein n=1 Tax=Nocardia sp. NPDC127526 TaxID=3345393 RepID=UPI00363E3C08
MEFEWWIGSDHYLKWSDVAAWEVMEVLYSPHRWPRAATTRDGLPVLTVWGRTEEGRAIVVILRPLRSSEKWQILMAVPMEPRQLEEFTAWEAHQ